MKVVNFGSLNIDNVYGVKNIVTPGETISALSYQRYCGGKGLNQSIAFSRTGKTIYHAGIIGNEGEILLSELTSSGVDTKYLKKTDCESGHTIIQVDENGQNSIVVFKGANHMIDVDYVDSVLNDLNKGDWIVLQNEISKVGYIIDKAFEMGIKILFNPSPITNDILNYNIDKVSVLVLNEIEGRALCLNEDANEKVLAQTLKQKYPNTKIVLTIGEKGSVYIYKDEFIYQDSFKVKPIDTTGAGDTFTGYLLYGLIENLDIRKTLELATAAAAIAITKKGAASSIPKIDEVNLFLLG